MYCIVTVESLIEIWNKFSEEVLSEYMYIFRIELTLVH